MANKNPLLEVIANTKNRIAALEACKAEGFVARLLGDEMLLVEIDGAEYNFRNVAFGVKGDTHEKWLKGRDWALFHLDHELGLEAIIFPDIESVRQQLTRYILSKVSIEPMSEVIKKEIDTAKNHLEMATQLAKENGYI